MTEGEKLKELSDRIQAAQAKGSVSAEDQPSRNAGYDFVGAIIGSMIVGWLIDREFSTSPWGLVGMVVVGFGIGVMNVWRSVQSSQAPAAPETEKKE